jgi:UDP-N-acetylmuramate--alanine ligase
LEKFVQLRDIKSVHIIGIGGIGMSAIAQVLPKFGIAVQGSDLKDGAITDKLKAMGMKIFTSQAPQNIEGAEVIVRSTAVKDDNPEIQAARQAGLTIMSRAEMLRLITQEYRTIAISGTHGKTTTSSMMAEGLMAIGEDITFIGGGILNSIGSNAVVGAGNVLVVEADESDATFCQLDSNVRIATNMEAEHLDFYGSYDNIRDHFRRYLQETPKCGFAVAGIDNANLHELVQEIGDQDNIFTYGSHIEADLRISAEKVQPDGSGILFSLRLSERLTAQLGVGEIEDVFLPTLGSHNVQNACAVVATILLLGHSVVQAKQAIASFTGVKRRFTRVGESGGVLVVDDYAHHPTEVLATLAMAKTVAESRGGRVVSVFQPHRYTRLRDNLGEFGRAFTSADQIYVTEVYAAGENPIAGIDAQSLVERLNGGAKVVKENELLDLVQNSVYPRDVLIFMGAGDITKWAYNLYEELEKNA